MWWPPPPPLCCCTPPHLPTASCIALHPHSSVDKWHRAVVVWWQLLHVSLLSLNGLLAGQLVCGLRSHAAGHEKVVRGTTVAVQWLPL